jgi:hypothetical protein
MLRDKSVISLFLRDTDTKNVYHQLTFFCILVNPKEMLKIYRIEHKIYPNHQDEWSVYHMIVSRCVYDFTVYDTQ